MKKNIFLLFSISLLISGQASALIGELVDTALEAPARVADAAIGGPYGYYDGPYYGDYYGPYRRYAPYARTYEVAPRVYEDTDDTDYDYND